MGNTYRKDLEKKNGREPRRSCGQRKSWGKGKGWQLLWKNFAKLHQYKEKVSKLLEIWEAEHFQLEGSQREKKGKSSGGSEAFNLLIVLPEAAPSSERG